MKTTQIVPGCVHVQGSSSSALLGSPPEILKQILKRQLSVPRVGVLPDITQVDGVSQMAFEFLGYWFLFVEKGFSQGGRFRIIGTAEACDRLREILRLTLLGPSREEMKRWGLSKARIDLLAAMSDGLALPKDGAPAPVETLFDFVAFPEDGSAVPLFAEDAAPSVRRLGDNCFELKGPEGSELVDLNFEGEQMPLLADLSGEVEKPQRLRVKMLGSFSGFDPAGPTSGMLLWVNANAFLVDVPSGVGRYLRQVGVSKDQLSAVILTHVHDDHCSLSELVLTEHEVTLITTREIYESAVAKVAAILGEPADLVKPLLRFVEVIPGKRYAMFGASWEFFYTVHSIPAFGFRVAVLGDQGEPQIVLHSGDTCSFAALDDLERRGVISAEHGARMRGLVRGDERLAVLDAGGAPIHGNPPDWDAAIARYPGTEFLMAHVNPSKVDGGRYKVSSPGWSRTYLPARSLEQSVYTGVMKGLRLFEVKDPAWINVILSQGQVVEVPAKSEVVSKGQEGDAFYFVLGGVMDVIDPEEEGGPLVATLEAGDFFGEISIIRHSATTATVTSRSPAVLFKLRGELFLEFVEKNHLQPHFQSLWSRRPLIASVGLFRDLEPAAKHEISLLARSRSFAPGEVIVRQGGKGDEFYVIASGDVRVLRVGDRGLGDAAVRLSAGDFFGENVAMGYTDQRNATVQAIGPVETLMLTGAELRGLAQRMPVLRHKLHLVMKDRGLGEETLRGALLAQASAQD
jgi:CRP-like cAMP-binding protein